MSQRTRQGSQEETTTPKANSYRAPRRQTQTATLQESYEEPFTTALQRPLKPQPQQRQGALVLRARPRRHSQSHVSLCQMGSRSLWLTPAWLGCCPCRHPPRHSQSLPALTTPFSTQKPSWYLESGRRMTAVVTGGQCTMFSVTSVWCFSSWKMEWGRVRLQKATWRG